MYLELMVCRADMNMRGSSTAKKTEMTTINISVVLFASLCLLFSLRIHDDDDTGDDGDADDGGGGGGGGGGDHYRH